MPYLLHASVCVYDAISQHAVSAHVYQLHVPLCACVFAHTVWRLCAHYLYRRGACGERITHHITNNSPLRRGICAVCVGAADLSWFSVEMFLQEKINKCCLLIFDSFITLIFRKYIVFCEWNGKDDSSSFQGCVWVNTCDFPLLIIFDLLEV